MPYYYRITGRIRDDGNLAVEGFTVHAFDKDPGIYFHPDDRLGRAVTDHEGSFEITFSENVFKDWFEGDPEIFLVIRDREGRVLITTENKENVTRHVDFQIKLGEQDFSPDEPDLYAGGLDRIIAALRSIGDAADLSKSDVRVVFEVLVRVLGSWAIYRDELVRSYGYDAIQVPRHPRKEKHDHITRWDKPVLPV